MSSLKALTKVMRPPTSPSEAPDEGGWEPVEAKLGIELPEDYKEFVSTYGTGAVDNFLWVLNPFSQNKNLNLLNQVKVNLDALRQLCIDSNIRIPYEIYPDVNGLFPWAITDNGDSLYWLTKSFPSNRWIVVGDSAAFQWREFKLSTAEFLALLVTKELVVDIFPDDFPSDAPEFVRA